MTVTHNPNAEDYLLGTQADEIRRLEFQAAQFAREANWLLDEIGVAPGWRAMDLGCGPIGILDLLSARVGPEGEVIGIDAADVMVEAARANAAQRGLHNVAVRTGDGCATGLPPSSFDVVHDRLVLVNIADPHHIVTEMARLVRPGGWVATEEVDWVSWTCEPASAAWDHLLRLNEELWAARGLDVNIGRRLPNLLRDAGLVDVGFQMHSRHWRPGHPYHSLLVTFSRLYADEFTRHGLISPSELHELVAEVAAHLADPSGMTIYALFCQAWGRRPATPDEVSSASGLGRWLEAQGAGHRPMASWQSIPTSAEATQ